MKRNDGIAAEEEVYSYLRCGMGTSRAAWAASHLHSPRIQIPFRCRYRELHFRCVADLVDVVGVWELKCSSLPLRALTLLTYPQLCIYAWGLSVPIAGVINLHTQEVEQIGHTVTQPEMEAIYDILRYRN